VEWIEEPLEKISWEYLIVSGLIGEAKARMRREALCDTLGIGYCNGKQLHKRLRIFQISEEEFIKALESIDVGE